MLWLPGRPCFFGSFLLWFLESEVLILRPHAGVNQCSSETLCYSQVWKEFKGSTLGSVQNLQLVELESSTWDWSRDFQQSNRSLLLKMPVLELVISWYNFLFLNLYYVIIFDSHSQVPPPTWVPFYILGYLPPNTWLWIGPKCHSWFQVGITFRI